MNSLSSFAILLCSIVRALTVTQDLKFMEKEIPFTVIIIKGVLVSYYGAGDEQASIFYGWEA
jgi:hypothetical protein